MPYSWPSSLERSMLARALFVARLLPSMMKPSSKTRTLPFCRQFNQHTAKLVSVEPHVAQAISLIECWQPRIVMKFGVRA
eukprot:6198437-Pleurochrysis_carterae.AAC.5